MKRSRYYLLPTYYYQLLLTTTRIKSDFKNDAINKLCNRTYKQKKYKPDVSIRFIYNIYSYHTYSHIYVYIHINIL